QGILAAGGYATFVSDEDAFEAIHPGVAGLVLNRWPALNNGGDAVILTCGAVRLDSVMYAGSWGVPGRSIERRNPHLLSNAATNWGTSADPTGGTPGRLNSLFSIDDEPPRVVYAEQEDSHELYFTTCEPLQIEEIMPADF